MITDLPSLYVKYPKTSFSSNDSYVTLLFNSLSYEPIIYFRLDSFSISIFRISKHFNPCLFSENNNGT